MEWWWVIPDPDRFVSGGNIYNSSLKNALSSLHVSNLIVSPTNIQQSLNQVLPDTIIWDTYYLNEIFIHDLPQSSNVYLLVHMITQNFLDRLSDIQRRIQGFITTSQWSSSQLRGQGIPAELILTLEPGLPLQPGPLPARILPSDKLQLILVANLVPEKGHEHLFLALKNYTNRANHIQIDLYGDDGINPHWSEYIIGQIKHCGLSEIVHYKGKKTQFEILQTLKDYHALLSVSPIESYGMAIREALFNRLPVLAIAGGNVPFLVKNKINGYLFEDISKMITWLTLPLEEQLNLLSKIGKVNMLLPEILTWENQAITIMKWINKFNRRAS